MAKKTQDHNRERLEQKAEIDKIDNRKVAKRIDVYTNSVIDTVVYNKDVKGYTPPNVMENLININKPKIDKDYSKVINNQGTSDTLLHQITVQRTANNKAVQISEEQYARLQKNIEVITGVLNKYEVNIDKYKELNEKYPKTTSRKGIVTESIMNKNYLTGTLGLNIVPHFDGYKELSPLTEALHRQAQNEASLDLAEAQNEEAEKNGEELPNTHKTWIWTGAGVTTRHESNDGQTVPIDQPFIITNDVDGQVDEMMYPLDPNVTSSNGWICYCEVEYHNRGEEDKFELTPQMIQALDSSISALNDRMPNEAYDSKIEVGEPVDTSGLELDAMLSDNIPSEHSGLATKLIEQYSKVTNLETLPMNATYQVLHEHFKVEAVNELGEIRKKVEANKKPTVADVTELVQKQIETWEIVQPKTIIMTPKLQEIEVNLEWDTEYFKEKTGDHSDLNVFLGDIVETFYEETNNKTFTAEEVQYLEHYVEDILKTTDGFIEQFKEEFPTALNYEINQSHLKQVEHHKINLKDQLDAIKKKVQKEDKVKQPAELSPNLKSFKDELDSKAQFLEENGGKGVGALKHSISSFNDAFFDKTLMSLNDYTVKDIPYIEKYVQDTIKTIEEHYKTLEANDAPNFENTKAEIIAERNELEENFSDFKKMLEVKAEQEGVISEASDTILETIDKIDNQIKENNIQEAINEHNEEQAKQEAKDADKEEHYKEVRKKQDNYIEKLDYDAGVADSKIVELLDDYNDENFIKAMGKVGELVKNMQEFTNENVLEDYQIENINEIKTHITDLLEVWKEEASIGEQFAIDDKLIKLDYLLKEPEPEPEPVAEEKPISNDYINNEEIRESIKEDLTEMDAELKKIRDTHQTAEEYKDSVIKIKNSITEIISYKSNLSEAEVEQLINKSKLAKDLINEKISKNQINNGIIDDSMKVLEVEKNKIPNEIIIKEVVENLREGEYVDFDKSTYIARGQTVAYFKKFEPVKPSDTILNKFKKMQELTPEEIKSLTPNNIRYIMELMRQEVITDMCNDYKPVGTKGTNRVKELFGVDVTKTGKFDSAITKWSGSGFQSVNEFYTNKAKFLEGEERRGRNRADVEREYNEYVKDLKELTGTEVEVNRIYTRGNGNRFHLGWLNGVEINEPSQMKVGMTVKTDRFNSMAINEDGAHGFANVNSQTGEVRGKLITILGFAGHEGGYLDGKSQFENECETLQPPDTYLQIISFDSNTCLCWIVKK